MFMLLSERNQSEEATPYMIPTIYGILGKEKLETKKLNKIKKD